jgi:DNA-binding PadR family transcriptional regulator
MSPVFRHGRLRLYLLKLLEESPRHGYEVIRLLQDRFLGVYSPSPGTIYPRLARLEEEGLVTHEVRDGKKVFTITDKGRAELNARLDELAELEQEIADSVRDIAREVKEDVRETVRALRDELTRVARDMRRSEGASRTADRGRPGAEERRGRGPRVSFPFTVAWGRPPQELLDEGEQWAREWLRIWDEFWRGFGGSGAGGTRQARRERAEYDAELGRMLADFVARIRREAAEAELDENTLTYCREALDDVAERIREALRR